jgi:ferredoxin-NADP reductase
MEHQIPMTAYETHLVRRETVAEDTMAFYLERPAGFAFEAGQHATLRVLEPTDIDGFGQSRTFTFASAPHEPELMIATRMRDTAFKRTLRSAPLGLRVGLDGPEGLMLLKDEDVARPAVFIAGGIGVTPFLSIARRAAKVPLPHRIHLFYSNRRPEDAPFLEELRELERANTNFRLIPTMTQMHNSRLPWEGETGPIREEMLARHLPDLKSPVYYLAGPPGMAMGMQVLLDRLGIADRDVRGEEFYGY